MSEEASQTTQQTYSLLGRIKSAEENLVNKAGGSYHKHPKILFRMALLFIIGEMILFLVWILTTPYGFPWFIYPGYVGILVVWIFFIWGTTGGYHKNKPYSIHAAFFWLTSAVLILTNLYVSTNARHLSFPWAMYPIAVLAIAFSIHSLQAVFTKYWNHFTVHMVIFLIAQVVMFLSWAFTSVKYPWFLIVMLVWGIILSAHWILKHHGDFNFFTKWVPKRRGSVDITTSSGGTNIPADIELPVEPKKLEKPNEQMETINFSTDDSNEQQQEEKQSKKDTLENDKQVTQVQELPNSPDKITFTTLPNIE